MDKMKRIEVTAMQIGVLYGVSLGLDRLAHALHLRVPGSILGFVLLFALLKTGLLPLKWIEKGANTLIAEMLLFFVPAAAGIIQFQDLLRSSGIPMLLVIVASTLLVMLAAGLIVQWMDKPKEKVQS